jgi:hypothetical protein
MTTKLFAITFTIVLLFSQPSFLLGQSVSQQQDWTAVQNLSTGIKLLIETKDGKSLKGNLNNVSATTLTLSRNNTTANFNRDDIRKIYQFSRGGARVKSALIGTAVGAGIGVGGAAIALGSTGGSDDTTGILTSGILIGAGIGAVIGLVAGKGSRRVLVYESR